MRHGISAYAEADLFAPSSRDRNARLGGGGAQPHHIRPFVEKSMKEQPIATLAGVAVLAFALGALWKK